MSSSANRAKIAIERLGCRAPSPDQGSADPQTKTGGGRGTQGEASGVVWGLGTPGGCCKEGVYGRFAPSQPPTFLRPAKL